MTAVLLARPDAFPSQYGQCAFADAHVAGRRVGYVFVDMLDVTAHVTYGAEADLEDILAVDALFDGSVLRVVSRWCV